MNKILKRSLMLIFVLFMSLILPFSVEAKSKNSVIKETELKGSELISGDEIVVKDIYEYVATDDQKYNFDTINKVTNFEYYIIDSIDSKGNIKYKKYDFKDSPESVWYPEGYKFHIFSGDEGPFPNANVFINFSSCSYLNSMYDSHNMDIGCKVVLPAINGKISRWRFDEKKYGEKSKIDVCLGSGNFYVSCSNEPDESYVGTYEFYTSYVNKFYEIPNKKPKLTVVCDTNKLSHGKSTKCKVNFSYEYALDNVLFNITSDKLKISKFEVIDEWNAEDTDEGYSLIYYGDGNDTYYKDGKDIATFEVTTDADVNDILASLTATDFRYIDKLGENTLDDFSLDFDLGNDKDNNNDNKDNSIINPNTFKNSYYLLIGILIIGGISFIQIKSKRKNKQKDDNHIQ